MYSYFWPYHIMEQNNNKSYNMLKENNYHYKFFNFQNKFSKYKS